MRLFILCLVVIVMPASVRAQETRADAIAAEQADKATRLTTRERTFAERLLLSARETMLLQPSGFYPYFDSVYSGGGFTLGAGYRQFTGDRTHVNVAGLYSISGYKLIEVGATSPGHWQGRLDLRAASGLRDATQVAYHGLGIDSAEDDATAFRMEQVYGGGEVTARPRAWPPLSGGVWYERYTISDPTGGLTPVDDNYDAATAPGVGVNPSYLHTFAAAGVDTRPAADYARRGTLFQLAHHHYADRDAAYSFSRVDAEAVQHIPILRENWVVSLRGRVQSTIDDGDQVPYFLMPALGSGSTLRGFSSWRFRDRHAALVSAEWRWIASRLALDMALFYDAGMVAPRFKGLTLGEFVNDYGVGIRFHGPAKTPLRVELARSVEGMRIVFAASAAF